MTTAQTVAPRYERSKVYDAIRENLWIHFTQMADFQDPAARPTVIVRGEGSTIWDDQGNELLDGLAGLYSVNAGYGRREIVDAMVAQLEQIPFVNAFAFASVPAAVLADRLGELAPLGGNARVFFTSGGSESVETALKLAKQYQSNRGFSNRYKTISRRGAYHGTTMGALSVNGVTSIKNAFGPLVPGARHVEMSNAYRSDDDGYDAIEKLVAFEGPETIAAIITEPVQNSGGCVPPASEDYFKKIRKLCDETGILMIMDEVICGFGRLGALFGSEVFGVEPDIITTAKGITSSYAPLGAVLVRKSVADVFNQGQKFNHGLTFGGHPASAAAGLANLDIFLREDLAGRSKIMGAYLRSELEAALGDNPIVGDIRGIGLFQGVELVKDRATKETPNDHEAMVWLTDELRRKGIMLRVDERVDPTTQFSPPLIITKEEIDRMVLELTACITEIGRRWGKIGSAH
ncbi:MAG: aminotransferase class III-fold pyridoxal phosphate-dependent enzyme [Thermomicrobiales bacterium]|nr:aminotransferase class III-fold pyridoxal phosphate-dependent enzyme [Thermomicrobiales bacterium]